MCLLSKKPPLIYDQPIKDRLLCRGTAPYYFYNISDFGLDLFGYRIVHMDLRQLRASMP